MISSDRRRSPEEIEKRISALQFRMADLNQSLKNGWHIKPTQYVIQQIFIIEGQIQMLRWALGELATAEDLT